MRKRMTVVAVALALASTPGPGVSQQILEFEGRTWLSTAPDAKVGEFRGRQALLLRSGAVLLQDMEFQDGTVEYDVAVTGHRSFVGTAFRLRQAPRREYEHFYIRPHQTGRFDALQYTPEINDISAWQLYPEYNATVDVPRGEWIHVRLVVEGRHLEAYVGDATEPSLRVDDLRLPPQPGLVGLTSNFPEAGRLDIYPTAYSNIRITPADAPSPTAPAAAESRPEGTVEEWAISESLPGLAGDLTGDLPRDLHWEVVATDALGRLNLAEHRGFVPGTPGVHVYARVVIHSEREQRKKLNFGFSDRGSVFLNGALLFEGNNTYLSRSQRYLGVMTLDNDALYLDLDAGPNELLFVVSEAFGGWGLVARLGDLEGISVTADAPGG